MKETKRTIKEQELRRQKNTIGIAFIFFKIVINRKAGSQKKFTQARRAKEDTISIELMVKTSNFNSEIMRHGTALKFVKTR